MIICYNLWTKKKVLYITTKYNIKLYYDNIISKEYEEIRVLHKSDNYIFYLDEVKTSLNNKYFIRENNDYCFTINIKNNTSTLLLKENNYLYDVDVEYLNFKEEEQITLEYKISTDEHQIKLVLERMI